MNTKGALEHLSPWRILTDDVVLAIYRAAVEKLNPAAMRLWMEVVEGYYERTETKLSGEVKVCSDQPPIIIKIQ